MMASHEACGYERACWPSSKSLSLGKDAAIKSVKALIRVVLRRSRWVSS